MIADAIGISRKNIYRIPKQEEKDLELAETIKEAHKVHPAYGQYRMSLYLGINHKRIERIMKKYGIKPPRRKAKKHYCTISTDTHKYVNLIKDIDSTLYVPNMIWVCDISYIKYKRCFWYMATIEDLATRQILGCRIGKHHDAELIMAVIKQAMSTSCAIPVYYHSDQGTENMAGKVTDYLEGFNVKISVSDKGSPWQNGYKESFFGRFKEEFGEIERFDTISELIEEIYAQVRYYNFDRIHSVLKMPPVTYAEINFLDSCLQKRGT